MDSLKKRHRVVGKWRNRSAREGSLERGRRVWVGVGGMVKVGFG